MEEILKKIRELNLINDFSPSVDAFDLDRLAGRLNSLKVKIDFTKGKGWLY